MKKTDQLPTKAISERPKDPLYCLWNGSSDENEHIFPARAFHICEAITEQALICSNLERSERCSKCLSEKSQMYTK